MERKRIVLAVFYMNPQMLQGTKWEQNNTWNGRYENPKTPCALLFIYTLRHFQ